MKNYLCMDIGGTAMKCAVVNEEANILEQESIKTPSTLEDMYKTIQECFEGYQNYDLQGLALSMPGAVDSDAGIIGGSSAIDYIHGPCIKDDLEKILKVPVEMENDANCAALAEVWKGAGSDVDDCCFIVSGTGIGGAVVKNKRIHKGKHLHGGEFGYMIADFDYDTKEIYFKAVDRYYWAMANGIYNLQYAYDPEKIIIGGAISVREDLLEEIQKRLDVIFANFTHAHIKPVVCTCTFHNEANLLGALYHLLTKNS